MKNSNNKPFARRVESRVAEMKNTLRELHTWALDDPDPQRIKLIIDELQNFKLMLDGKLSRMTEQVKRLEPSHD